MAQQNRFLYSDIFAQRLLLNWPSFIEYGTRVKFTVLVFIKPGTDNVKKGSVRAQAS